MTPNAAGRPWPTFRLWRQRFKNNYKALFWGSLILTVFSLWLGVELNQNGHRMWNLGIGLLVGAVVAYHLFKPTILEWVGGAGVVANVTDGKRESLAKELGGGITLIGQYARLVTYVLVIVMTVFTMLALKRFEDPRSAYLAILAAAVFGLIFWVFMIKGRWFETFLLIFWGVLMLTSIGMAYFVPDYFRDDISYRVRHIQGDVEAARREAIAAPIEARLRAGETLTRAERETLQNLRNQEMEVERYTRRTASTAFLLGDGLPEREVQLPITPGRYTCQAEMTARQPEDLEVRISGIPVALATTAYINGQPCNGSAVVDFGPDGRSMLHFNLDPDARAQVRGASRHIRLTFTPA